MEKAMVNCERLQTWVDWSAANYDCSHSQNEKKELQKPVDLSGKQQQKKAGKMQRHVLCPQTHPMSIPKDQRRPLRTIIRCRHQQYYRRHLH
jgi:hypothetical protein